MYSYDADSLRSGKDEELDILSSLGGKAATEIVLCKTDMGCADDFSHALNSIGCLHITYCATSLDVQGFMEESEWLKAYRDREVAMQLRNYYEKCKRIIHANRLFLDHLIRNLIDCRIITFRDIERIREDLMKEREVMEETGVEVTNIRYYKSQPWALAQDILAGFFCEVDGDDTIRMDEGELKYAEWVSRSEIELQPSDYSLTNEMMRMFRDGKIS
jgi:hypothetical protein